MRNLAQRMELLGFSDIVRIRNRVLDMLARGERVLRLEGGEPFMPTPDFIKDAMKAALDANQTRYAPSSGIPQLLEAIRAKVASRNGIEVPAADIIVTSGGAHGLFCAFQATTDPGDDVMLFAPYWTPIRDQVRYSGGALVRVPWSDTRGVEDLGDLLRAHRTERTRVLYVNTPSNPTGDVLSRTQLESIARFAVEHDLTVISDEAYEDLVYEGEHVSLMSLAGMRERTISVYTLSKSFAMTGWRVGYLIAEKRWMDGLKKLVLNSINGVSTPSQFAAAAAVANGHQFIDSILGDYRVRRDHLVHGLTAAGFACVPPRGAFYLFADARERLGADSWQSMETLLARTSIASVPGVVFGPEGEGFLRLSFSTSMEVVDQAVEALRQL